ncbi:hypothetical protein EUGRSUZ_F04412 [Eucalyptus grandis]|uniref:MATH domain-containing protein n=2 Tax=Eucalyptus grandis TaxID=71139 RepID=A0A059C090_EUCGR|nr:hypothetical protein EUGRSUZ_F04412 [Eucalyptus grandis]
MSSASKDEPELDTLSSRRCPPAHYVAKINPVTELLKLPELKFGPFEVGGYNWRLLLKPQKVYMSLYLEIDDPYKIGRNEEVLVDYKFFVFDYNHNKYDIFKERGKELRAFTREKTRWGFSEFLSLKGFNDPQRGYLDNDFCKIGAELLVSKPIRTKVALTIKNPSTIKDTPKIRPTIQGFSASESRPKYSETFTLEGRDWKLKVRPEPEKGTEWLSVHLEAQGISPGKLLLVNAILRVLNTDPKKFKEKEVKGWLRANNCTCVELKFMPWSDLKKGFIQGNELKFEVKILTVVNITRNDELAKSLP